MKQKGILKRHTLILKSGAHWQDLQGLRRQVRTQWEATQRPCHGMEHRLTALGVTGQGSPLTLRIPSWVKDTLLFWVGSELLTRPPPHFPGSPDHSRQPSPPPGDAVAMTTKVSRGCRWGHAEKTALLSVVRTEGGSIVTQLDQSLGWRTCTAPASFVPEGSNTTNQKSLVFQQCLSSALTTADVQDRKHLKGQESSKELPRGNVQTQEKQ